MRVRANRSLSCVCTAGREGEISFKTARLERDHPAIHERLKRGEYKSVRAAAKEAGLVRDEIRVPLDVERAAHAINRAFSQEDVLLLASTLEALANGGK